MISKPGLVTIRAALSALAVEGEKRADVAFAQKRLRMALTEVQAELDAMDKKPQADESLIPWRDRPWR